MLWNGEAPDARALKENMTTYFNLLQGFLLLSHGSMVGAGPTLSSSVLASAKQVVDCSFKLMHGSVSLYGKNLLSPLTCFMHCYTSCHTIDNVLMYFLEEKKSI